MNVATKELHEFILDCYNNESVSRNTTQRDVLRQMCCDTDNLGVGFHLNTWIFSGAYPNPESLTSAVESSLEGGLEALQESSRELIELSRVVDGDKFFDHHTYIASVDAKSIQWGKLTEALWGDDVAKYFKTAVFLTRHHVTLDQIESLEGSGYKVYTLAEYANTPIDKKSFTFKSAKDAYELACNIVGRPLSKWDVVIGVLPSDLIGEFLLLCPAPLLRALMRVTKREQEKTEYAWEGVFNEIKKYEVSIKRWYPS